MVNRNRKAKKDMSLNEIHDSFKKTFGMTAKEYEIAHPELKESPHTPTPWTLGLSENEWGERSIWANAVKGEPKTTVVGPLNQANAAFIVRAVNQHEFLVRENARLRATHQHIIDLIKEALKCMDVSCYVDARECLNEAIAKAERR